MIFLFREFKRNDLLHYEQIVIFPDRNFNPLYTSINSTKMSQKPESSSYVLTRIYNI